MPVKSDKFQLPLLPLIVDWSQHSSLPNIVFLRSSHGHQTIADVMVPLFESSPLWIDHLAQIAVPALSSPSALSDGLFAALQLCQSSNDTWVVALVRGGGSDDQMARFSETLQDPGVQPLVRALAPRLIFAAGHTRDAQRYEWLRALCLAFGEVPLEAGRQFVRLLEAKGLFKRVHRDFDDFSNIDSFLPTPADLPRVRRARDLERLALRIHERQHNRIERARVIPDAQFIEQIHLGGLLIGFLHVGGLDYQAMVITQDYEMFRSDSAYSLLEWRKVLELSGVEQWEVDQAMEKLH